MNHNVIKKVIFDQHEVIRNSIIINRPEYEFDDNANYIVIGLRRSGKSTLLYRKALELVKNGISFNQIIYINFEDDRLLEFNVNDFDDILEVASELTDKKKYYFFDEIQNIEGWERFARRMADSKEFVYITGSNAKMLSKEMAEKLGGRFLPKLVFPYSFKEYLKACDIDINVSNKAIGTLNASLNNYLEYGGLPEIIQTNNKREYIRSVYSKVLLNDIILHNNLRNENAIKLLVKKMAETVKDEMSFTKMHNILKSIGFSISKDTVIDYVSFIINSYLVFDVKNYFMSFIDKESTPKYYFIDNGILNLFLNDKKGILLENVVASYLKSKYFDDLYYIKSSKTGIDIDFFIPAKCAIQVTYSLEDVSKETFDREVNDLIKLNDSIDEKVELIIITLDKSKTINAKNTTINVMNIVDFLTK